MELLNDKQTIFENIPAEKRMTKRKAMVSNFCPQLELDDQEKDDVYNITNQFAVFPQVGKRLSYVSAVTSVTDQIIEKKGLNIENIALDCEEIPLEELQNSVSNHFYEIKRDFNENLYALRNLRNLAEKQLKYLEKLRSKVGHSLKITTERIIGSEEEVLISKIKNFSQYFFDEKAKIENFLETEDFAIERESKFLEILGKSESQQNLPTLILKLVDKDLAYSVTVADERARKVQASLYYGSLTYFTVMYYLLKNYSYIADYYYENKQLHNYNKYFAKIIVVFKYFKLSLTEKGSFNGKNSIYFLERVIQTFEKVKNMDIDPHNSVPLYIDAINNLKKLKRDVETTTLPLIFETPKNDIKAFFKQPHVEAPFEEWKIGTTVSYAVQFMKNGQYSRVSEWTDTFEVQEYICPFLKMSVDPQKRKRLIFRRFNADKPKLIGIVDPGETEFRDIHRDVYELSRSRDEAAVLPKLEILLKAGGSVNEEFENGRKAYHAAAEQGNNEIAFKFLLSDVLNKKDINGYTPMHLTAQFGHPNFAKLLVDRNVEINAQTNTNLLSPLHFASHNGFIKVMEILLSSPKINVNIKDSFGFTPMHHAILGGIQVIKLLIKHPNVNVNSKAIQEISPLHLACMFSKDAVEYLLNNSKVDINAVDVRGATPLHIATIAGNLGAVKKLLTKSNINVNAETHNAKLTPLQFSILLKKSDVTLLLLKAKNIDFDSVGINGLSPLHVAVAERQIEIVKVLLSKKANIEQKTIEGLTPLHLACLLKEENIAHLLIETDANISARANNLYTPLHFASSAGRDKIVNKLIENNADLKAKDKNGKEPLDLAVENDHDEIIEYIINKMFKTENKDNRFPFFYESIRKGNLKVVKYLINHKLINIEGSDRKRLDVDNTNKSVKYWATCDAITFGHLEIIDYYFEEGLMSFECPPLLKSAQSGLLYLLKYFIEVKHLNVNGTNNPQSLPPLFAAINNENMTMVKYLLDKKADINLIWDSKSCLAHAVQTKNLNLVKYLVNKGANLQFKDPKGNTILHYAAQSDEILKYLIEEKHLDINAQNNEKKTALDLAAKYLSKDTIQFLCFLGSDPADVRTYIMTRIGRSTVENCLKTSNKNVKRDTNEITFNKIQETNVKNTFHKKLRLDKKEIQGAILERTAEDGFFNPSGYLKHRHSNGDFKNSLKHVESSKNSGSINLNDVYTDGTLLLLNVLLRKVNGNNLNINTEKSVSISEAQATALNIVEILQKSLNDKTLVEKIDFSRIHRHIFKAIMTGKPYDMPLALCSNLEKLSKVGYESINKLSASESKEINLKQSYKEVILPMIQKICSNANSFNSNLVDQSS